MTHHRHEPRRPTRTRWRHMGRNLWGDLYHGLLTMSWPRFIGGVTTLFLLMNTVFAVAYLADSAAIVHAHPGSFLDAFFFSVQTMATIGYGSMYPGTVYGNLLMTLESLVGLFGMAIATGLAFVRFSRPMARILFSRYAVVSHYQGVPTLMFRAANQRGNQILEARVQVALLRDEQSPEGHAMRRVYDLQLIRQHTPSFSLSWMIMHPLDKNSPMFGITADDLRTGDAQLIVILAGLDETLSQTIHARHLYGPADIQWGRRLRDVLSKTAAGERVVDYSKFDDLIDD